MSAATGLGRRRIRLLVTVAHLVSPLLATSLCVSSTSVFAAAAASATSGFVVPAWAYPTNPPAGPAAPAENQDVSLLHLPGSDAAYTHAQVKDLFAAPDWYPDDHPTMPEVVAHGRKPSVYACGYCHLPDGSGRPENASVAGLPAAYIIQQVRDMASGERHSAWEGPYPPSDFMRKVAENVNETEILEAAAYFSSLRLARRAEIVEAERVPVTHTERWIYVRTEGAGDEPLGQRIIELARDHERHELRDPQNGSIAYVPPGSIARGGQLVVSGAGGRTLPCGSCHGADLRGVGLIPPIAGRSPSYILRQLLAFRTGARSTPAGQPMQSVVKRLEVNDMIAIAAYAASREP
jgi:cytochrome c553